MAKGKKKQGKSGSRGATSSSSSGGSPYLIPLLLLFAVLLGGLVWRQSRKPGSLVSTLLAKVAGASGPVGPGHERLPTQNVMWDRLQQVDVLDWGPDKPFAAEMIDRGRPTILRNTIISKWAAMNWTEDYLASHPALSHPTQVRRVSRLFINYEPGLPLESVYGAPFWQNPSSRDSFDMSGRDFFRMANDDTDLAKTFLAQKVPVELLDDCIPRDGQLRLPGAEWVYFGLWIGEAGATTALHNDPDENFYAHFYGRKRFIMFPPEAYLTWKHYPRLSPNHKQVIVEPGKDTYRFRRAPGHEKPVGYEAKLQPGDLLYLPPYWYHHVEAMWSKDEAQKPVNVSISVNFWSRAKSTFPIIGVEELPGPFDHGRTPQQVANVDDPLNALFPEHFTPSDRVNTARVLMISEAIDRMESVGNANEEVKRMHWYRYEDVFGAAKKPPKGVCPPALDASVVKRMKTLLISDALAIAYVFDGIPKGITAIELHNMIEMRMMWKGFPLEHASDWFGYCWPRINHV